MAKTRTTKPEKSAKVATKAATKPASRPASKPAKPRRKAARINTRPPAHTPDELKFIADVLTRGEACQPSPSGAMPARAMPPGTTHELVARPTGTPATPQTAQIKRRRFSAI